jgi:nitrogenase molybdenum-iron protein alpha/beta subunit
MSNPRLPEHGVPYRFSSTNQPANRGRKPSKLKKWIKENNVSNEDFIGIFKNIIATHTIEELEKMIAGDNKKKLPVIVALCISAFIHDMKTGTLNAANSILDRIMGKPTQQVILGSGDRAEPPSSPEERRALAEKLRNELGLGKLPSEAAPADAETSGKPLWKEKKANNSKQAMKEKTT